MLIHNFLENSASKFPNKVALIHESTRATYAQINTDADHLASFLISTGIKKGDRIVIILENSYEYVVSYYGILKSGAVAVPLSTDLKPDGLNPLLTELEPSAVISSTRFERLLQASDLNVPNLNTLIIHNPKQNWEDEFKNVVPFSFLSTHNPQPTTHNQISPSDLSSIIYTSGSTGKPKGVMLTHGNIVSNTNSICKYQQLSTIDIQMVVLPFFYVMGKSLLNTIFSVGGTIVINNKFAFPATVINQMVEEKVTLFSGVPSTYAYLLHRSPLATNKNQLTTLRMVTQAGGHMAKSVKIALREALPNHTKIYIMYGTTEASARLTFLDPKYFTDKIDSIGQAIPGVTVKIIDEHGMDVQEGQKGEIIASGSNIMQGYWMDPKATSKVLDSHGYHTGDIGWQDEDGFIFLYGRKDDLLKVGGHRINPIEVEDALLATGLSVEAAVLGLQDELLGNKLMALVVPLNGDASGAGILEKCSSLLPKYKLPSEIKLVRSLPKNANGKVDRNRCIKMLVEGGA
jgi:acyl-CoA synthetase (AMP-forming)/AMP-acid ligase II